MTLFHAQFLRAATAACLGLALAACGGGSGGNDNAAAAALLAAASANNPPASGNNPPATTPPTTTPPDDPAPADPEDDSFDTYYNVCRGTNPKCYHDWGAFASTPDRVLIYSRTAGPRHANS